MTMRQKYIYILITINLIWTASAIIYDWNNIIRIPAYLWPFLLICQIYPLLLAIYWVLYRRDKRVNEYLTAFATIPSIIYLIAALIYYPSWMVYHHFNWLAFGGIFWVAAYGLQGVYIFLKNNIQPRPMIATVFFLITSLFVQYRYIQSLGQFDFDNMGRYTPTLLILFLAISSIALPFIKRK